MQTSRATRGAILLVALFVLQSFSVFFTQQEDYLSPEDEYNQIEWVKFDLREGVFNDAKGIYDYSETLEQREVYADSSIGVFDENGLILSRPVPSEMLQTRVDVNLLLISNQINLLESRERINEIQGLTIRDFIYPSGLVVQGTPMALSQAQNLNFVASYHSVPLAFFIQDEILDVLLLEEGEQSLIGQTMRLQGWRDDLGPQQAISFTDSFGNNLYQDVAEIAELSLENIIHWDEGRYEGVLKTTDIASIMIQPSVNSLRFNPQFTIDNNQAGSHMKTGTMKIYFNSDLDGSNQTVAVADSGLDDDHGDFGNRVVGNYDVINDGSTADKWSGHGTHVSCTVLGDGFRGGYTGVAPEADLYFQAMENDNTGNFQSPSLNYLLNSAYSDGARTHTNSWGSGGNNIFGRYTSESQDVDDRANYYDRYYNGAEGLTILFAAGNDGPNPDTIGPPSTAKNSVTVGMHQNRYSGAPDTIMSGSSRGPVDDGRIKPDVLAPGGYVRSCKAQEAGDTGGNTWSSQWYLEYTGTSMATPNAAGASAMIRQYLEEIALRESPQGALVKALLILGAEDVGARDIPNNDEGWGRINVRNSLAPVDGQGIWVDDRSLLSATGNSKSYDFDIDEANDAFKAVLTWSDEYASTSSNKQLVNNFDLEVTDPNGNVYLGNDFSNGRSTTGGSADNTNNVEVVLIDQAMAGQWTVKIKDTFHGGSRSQPFSLAVMGHGINDLLPDLAVVPEDYGMDLEIPGVGDEVHFTSTIENTGNVKSDLVDVVLQVNGVVVETKSMEVSGGAQKNLYWTWIPQTAGEKLISFIIDPDNLIDETSETNNRHDVIVEVTTPGVAFSSMQKVRTLTDPLETSTSWQVNLSNTGLLPINASISKQSVLNVQTGQQVSWYVGISSTNFSLEGKETKTVSVTMIHPETPQKGTYEIQLFGLDVDNGVSNVYTLELDVLDIANVNVEYNYDIVPVHPIEATTFAVYVENLGNSDLIYDLQVQPPNGWNAYFGEGESAGRFVSTEPIPVNQVSTLNLTIQPPNIIQDAGVERMISINVLSRTTPIESWIVDIPIKVEAVKSIEISLDSQMNKVLPNTEFALIYSIENKGNVDVRLYPSFILPQGIQTIEGASPFNLDIGESRIYILSLYAGQSSKTGQITMNLDNGSDRFSWNELIEVEIFAKPSLDFTGLVYESGEQYSNYIGSGSHYAGQILTYNWELSNLEDIDWTPEIEILSDDGLDVSCDAINTVLGLNDNVGLNCSVAVDSDVEPYSQPSFTLNMGGNGAQFSETISLYIAGVEEITWGGLSSNTFDTGEEKLIQIMATNTGNIPFNHRLEVTSEDDWDLVLDANDVVDLQVGESVLVRIKVTANEPGFSSIKLGFSSANSPQSSEFRFNVSATGESSDSFGSTGQIITSVMLVIVIIAIIGMSIALLKSKKQRPVMPMLPRPVAGKQFSHTPMPLPKNLPQIAPPIPVAKLPITTPTPEIKEQVVEEVQTPPPICWSCRNPIDGAVLGCPSCGARYHGEGHESCNISNLEKCVSCSGTTSDFIDG
tara:strand:- start:16691 stop:21310 length:4620 start_codon:yes stop_codon:yes gene_type:complete